MKSLLFVVVVAVALLLVPRDSCAEEKGGLVFAGWCANGEWESPHLRIGVGCGSDVKSPVDAFTLESMKVREDKGKGTRPLDGAEVMRVKKGAKVKVVELRMLGGKEGEKRAVWAVVKVGE